MCKLLVASSRNIARLSDFIYKVLKSLNSRESKLLVRFSVRAYFPYITSKSHKLVQTAFINMSVIRRMNDRQSAAVVTVGVRAELMLDLMRLEVRFLAVGLQ